jgi:hypothetical protein
MDTFWKWLDGVTGRIDKLAAWSRAQRLFYYAILSTAFAIAYFILLPRHDCMVMKMEAACSHIERSYSP